LVFRWAAVFCITQTFLLILIKTLKKYQPKSAKKIIFFCSIEIKKKKGKGLTTAQWAEGWTLIQKVILPNYVSSVFIQ
jgi:hypothetical protein